MFLQDYYEKREHRTIFDTTCGVVSDGHGKPFCTRAIIARKPWAIPIFNKTQFLKAISVIDKLSPIIFANKCCGKLSMCLAKFFASHITKMLFYKNL